MPGNVVVFGESGAGKSSIVNLLLGGSKAQVSDAALGCTFSAEKYETPNYTLFDTVGLSEGQKGTVAAAEAISQLVKLLKSLSEGVSLLVLVIEKGRIKKTVEENYKLFVDGICMNQVPVVLVVTHCEMDSEMDSWWKGNGGHFQTYGMTFKDAICGCAADPNKVLEILRPVIATRREETKGRLESSILGNMLETPWKMTSWLDWLTYIFKKVWNVIGAFFGSKQQESYLPNMTTTFVELGYDLGAATSMANKIYEDVSN